MPETILLWCVRCPEQFNVSREELDEMDRNSALALCPSCREAEDD